MKSRQITLITSAVLVLSLLLTLSGCGESTPIYKTTKTITHVPYTVTETVVVGQEKIFLEDGTEVSYDDLENVTDIEDVEPSENGSSQETPSSDKPMTDNFIEDGYFNYQLVRSASSNDTVTIIGKLINNGIKNNLSCKTNYKTDATAPKSNIRELLIGQTNRAASVIAANKLKAKRALCYYDAVVCTVGNNICILGYEKTALNNAINYFLNTYCNGQTKKVPKNIEWYFMGTNSVVKTSIGGNDISNYRLVIPSKSSNLILGSAKYMKSYLEEFAGAPIDIVYDSSPKSEYEIQLGATNRNISAPTDSSKAFAKINNKHLCYSSKNEDMIYMLVKNFAEGLKIAKLSYQIPNGYNETVTYDSLRKSFGDGYNLVWYDEFNEKLLNADVWSDAEAQSYSDIGATVLEGKKYNTFNTDGCVGLTCSRIKQKRFTEGRLVSNTMFMYGYMELKMKIMPGNCYASWWLNSYTSTKCRPEIDMLETFNSPKSLKANLHTWNDEVNGSGSTGHIDHSVDVDNAEWVTNRTFNSPGESLLADNWHIFGVEWTPDLITFYVDGEIYCKWDISQATTNDRYKAFRNIPCQMLITSTLTNDNSLPVGQSATTLVDYVRVYQRNASQTGYTSSCSYVMP